ncbi:MAG: O-antigen ligase domain-containing protein [Litoreibacter sp.]|nr:O-antigen ligase domain-containing protein [Litoreibacter sp.]
MAGPLQMTSVRLYMALLLVPLLISLFRHRPNATDLLLLLFVPWAGIAMWVNTPGQAIEHAGVMMLEMFCGYMLARRYITNAAQFVALIKAVLLLVLLCFPLAIYETLTGAPIAINAIRAIPGISSVEVADIEKRLGFERVQGLFAHPIHFGLFCASAVALGFVGLSKAMSPMVRWTATALAVATAFLALSSGAILSVMIQLFLILWAALFAAHKQRWWWLMAAIAAAYIFIDFVSNRGPFQVFLSYATYSAHNAYWRTLIFEWGMVNVWANPVFGLGLEDWVRPHFMYSGSMDNFWLAQAVRYGLPGFAILASAWCLAVYRVAASQAPQHLKMAWLYCMIGLTFTLCTVHVWTAIFSYCFFLLGAGQWMAAGRGARSKPAQLGFSRGLQPRFQRPAFA